MLGADPNFLPGMVARLLACSAATLHSDVAEYVPSSWRAQPPRRRRRLGGDMTSSRVIRGRLQQLTRHPRPAADGSEWVWGRAWRQKQRRCGLDTGLGGGEGGGFGAGDGGGLAGELGGGDGGRLGGQIGCRLGGGAGISDSGRLGSELSGGVGGSADE